MGRRRPRLTLMSRSFFSLHSIGHLKKKRESESESGVATARDGAPAMVSSSMMLPVYPSPSISYSEASWKHNKKFAKELSIEKEDHQLRSWFLHRRCSCALLRYMHGKNGAYTSLVALDSISVTACLNSIQFVLVFVFSL
ncbi:unnamed protein product [Brassica oleracea var. botrytis]